MSNITASMAGPSWMDGDVCVPTKQPTTEVVKRAQRALPWILQVVYLPPPEQQEEKEYVD